MSDRRIGFGGGCHWCTEAVFQALAGVQKVEQGFISSEPPYNSFSEAVLVDFDPKQIPLISLIEIHLRTHASTSEHKMREKYRSAVYVFSTRQYTEVVAALAKLQQDFEAPLVTKVLPFVAFKASADHFKNYQRQHSEGQFCRRYIDPKLKLLRQQYGSMLKTK